MSDTSLDKHILDELCKGNTDTWSRVVEDYQSRLLHYAQARVKQQADAEDLVQETFISFIRSVHQFRKETRLETYLFIILRNKVIDHYRTKRHRSVCLLQDVFCGSPDQGSEDAWRYVPAADASATWRVAQDEQDVLQRRALTAGLKDMVGHFKKAKNFQNLKICELLFYSNITNAHAAKILAVKSNAIAVAKHRALKQLKHAVAAYYQLPDSQSDVSDSLLAEIWESQRVSCPKRSTLGAFLLETLEPEWFDYVDFHLTTLGCHFCRASFKDLQLQKTQEKNTLFKNRILASTVGFFAKP